MGIIDKISRNESIKEWRYKETYKIESWIGVKEWGIEVDDVESYFKVAWFKPEDIQFRGISD